MARNNIPESEDDFIRMQQEAIRRVREMQERARRTLEGAGMHIEQNPPAQIPTAQQNAPGTGGTTAPEPPRAPVPPPQNTRAAEHASHPSAGHPQASRGTPAHPPAAHPPDAHLPRPQQPPRQSRPEPPPPPPANTGRGGLPALLAGGLPGLHLSLDSDQVLLAIILYVLIQDHGDQWLILALGYIILGGA